MKDLSLVNWLCVSFFVSYLVGQPTEIAFSKVRAMPQAGHIVSTWADTGKLHMFGCQEVGEKIGVRDQEWKHHFEAHFCRKKVGLGGLKKKVLPVNFDPWVRWNLDMHRKALDKGDRDGSLRLFRRMIQRWEGSH